MCPGGACLVDPGRGSLGRGREGSYENGVRTIACEQSAAEMDVGPRVDGGCSDESEWLGAEDGATALVRKGCRGRVRGDLQWSVARKGAKRRAKRAD